MGLWSTLLGWRRRRPAEAQDRADHHEESETTERPAPPVALPLEPFVFECRSCGKVFETRRKRARCPECDGSDVALLSE